MSELQIDEEELELCDHCLGRIFGMRGHGLTNAERGHALRLVYAMEHNLNIDEVQPSKCALCDGLFDRIEDYARYIAGILEPYEFDTFLVGSKFSESLLARERELHEKYGEELGESISREFNRELGKTLSDMLGKEVELGNPDIAVIVDTEYDDVKLEIKPLFIYGRYRKLVRGIPQTKWPSGKYKESVEEIIAAPVMRLTEGEAHALHGMGREDIDVRMLGSGRPFVLEISRPKKRKLDMKELETLINSQAGGKVEVLGLRESSRAEVRRIKTAKVRKKYRVGVQVDADEQSIRDALQKLTGEIRQRTPKRVAHRRADRVRVRHVYETQLLEKDEDVWIIDILAESGTYIKELMHGDDGRTHPSLAEILEREVTVKFLDVLDVYDSERSDNL